MRLSNKLKGYSAKRRTKDLVFYCLLLIFPIMQFCVFYISVNVNSIILSFKSYEALGEYTWVGFDNFKLLFNNFKTFTLFKVGFINSMMFFVVGTLIGSSLSLIFSYYIYKKAPLKNFFKIMLFLPSVIPAIALIVMFKQIADNGLPVFLGKIGVQTGGFLSTPEKTLGTILFYNIWVSFGVSTLLYVGAMEKISESVIEAAHLDGVGYFKELWHITVPLLYDTLSTFIIVAFGSIFINQANIFAFYGPGAEERVFTIGYWLYKETVKQNAYADYPMLSAFGLLLSAVTIPLLYFVRKTLASLGPDKKIRGEKA